MLVRWLVSFDRSVKIVRSVVVNCWDKSRWQTRISESVAEDSLYNIGLKDIEQRSSQLCGLWVDGVQQCDFWNKWNSFFNKDAKFEFYLVFVGAPLSKCHLKKYHLCVTSTRISLWYQLLSKQNMSDQCFESSNLGFSFSVIRFTWR